MSSNENVSSFALSIELIFVAVMRYLPPKKVAACATVCSAWAEMVRFSEVFAGYVSPPRRRLALQCAVSMKLGTSIVMAKIKQLRVTAEDLEAVNYQPFATALINGDVATVLSMQTALSINDYDVKLNAECLQWVCAFDRLEAAQLIIARRWCNPQHHELVSFLETAIRFRRARIAQLLQEELHDRNMDVIHSILYADPTVPRF